MCVWPKHAKRKKGIWEQKARKVLTFGCVSSFWGFIRAHGNNRHTVGLWIPPHLLQSNQEGAFTRNSEWQTSTYTHPNIYTPKMYWANLASAVLTSQWVKRNSLLLGLSLWTRQETHSTIKHCKCASAKRLLFLNFRYIQLD